MHVDPFNPWKDLPPALESFYSVPEISQSILLYEGSMEIIQEINQHPILESGSGKLNFAWFPHPVIQFEFSTIKPEFYVEMGDITLRLTQVGVSIKAHISSIKELNEGKSQVTGWIKEHVSIAG